MPGPFIRTAPALLPAVNADPLFRHLPPDARILLIRLRSMGDLLLLTSPVRALKSEFPRFRVSVLVEARFSDVFDGNPDVDETIVVNSKASTLARLLTRRFDAVINLHGGPTSLLYTVAAGGYRIGGEQYPYGWAYSATYPKPDPDLHTAASTLNTFRYLGLEAAIAPPLRFAPHAAAARRVQARLGAVGEGPYVVVHPAAMMVTKRWPATRFATLVSWLHRRGLRAVLTCGPGEEDVVQEVAAEARDALVLTGLTIPELAELVRGAKVYIGNDSGPMHLATAVGTPTVAVWGSSSAVRWHPWGVEHRVVQNPFACNPCPGYRCLVADSPLCIESVTVEQVQVAVQEIEKASGLRPRASGLC